MSILARLSPKTRSSFTRLILPVLCTAAALCIGVQAASAVEREAGRPRVVMLLVPGAMVEDVTAPDLPNFRILLNSGACAVMTSRTAGTVAGRDSTSTRTEAACLTLGAGARSAGSNSARKAHNASEPIGRESALDAYRRLSTKDAARSSILHLGIYEIRSTNAALPYDVSPGLLGQTLNSRGIRTACIGNSDTDKTFHREAVTVCMNAEGVVNLGDVSSRMSRLNPDAPYGLETDQDALLAAFDAAVQQAELVVIDSGDMARADWYAAECSDEQAQAMRRWAIRRADHLLGEIIRRIKTDCTLMVVSPCPTGNADDDRGRLAPVLVMGRGIEAGLLTSGSTRRNGLIANTDIAPSVLSFLGLPASASNAGRPVSSTALAGVSKTLSQLDRELTLQSSRLIVIRTTALVLLIIVISGGIMSRRRGICVALALIPPLTAPIMLTIPALGSHPPALTGVIAVSLTLICLVAIWLLRIQPGKALAWVSALFCAAIAVDLLRGGVWLTSSPFSYSPAEGSRYYGLGNELMGCFLGAMTVTAFSLRAAWGRLQRKKEQLRNLLFLALFGGSILLIGSPSGGANMGGALAAIATAGAAAYTLRKDRVGPKLWIGAGVVPVALFLAFVTIDGVRGGGSQSHLGRAVEMLVGGEAGHLGLILQRKIAMNLKLLQVSMWSKVLLACVGVLLYLRLRTTPVAGRHISDALLVIMTGSLAALVFNDSGVVAAATCIMYGWSLAVISDTTRRGETIVPPLR